MTLSQHYGKNSYITEWELLFNKISILKVNDSDEIPKGSKRMLINRDDSYKIKATLFFNDRFEQEDRPIGSLIEPFEIQGYDEYSRHYLLHCSFGGFERHHPTTPFHPEEGLSSFESEIDISIGEASIEYGLVNEVTCLTEWYLNGTSEPLVFNNSTERITSPTSYLKKRLAYGDKLDPLRDIKLGEGYSFSYDYFTVDFSDFKFLISSVPKDFGLKWSSNISIEYRKDFGRIPNENEREIIRELCSFVFGRQLLFVGSTSYDKEGNVVGGYARCPCGNAKEICSHPDYPPINIHDWNRAIKVGDIIKTLLPKYFELRSPLHLNEALWFYWVSSYTPVGNCLPILWGGIEEIMHGWFKYKNSKSKGTYVPKNDFDALLSDEIRVIEIKLKEGLKEKEDGDNIANKIVSKIKESYQMGPTDELRRFFQEIQLAVNEQELDSLELRHSFAHRSIDLDTPNGISWIKKTQAFETLFYKIFLKALNYSGSYVDRSCIPWVDKELN